MSKEKNDLTLKIFAFIIAIVLRSYVISEVNPDISREYKNVTVKINNENALDRQGLVVMEPQEVSISVRVTGKKSDMDRFDKSSIKAQVDLSGYREGQVKVPVNVSLDQLSNNIKITNYEPKDVLYTFDKIITINKNVTITTEGNLEPNYVLGDITTKPQSILLKGPRSWVNEVSEAVAVVKINGKKEDINTNVPIKLVNDKGNDVIGVKYEPSVIDVSIPVFRTVTVPIELQTDIPENYEITDITINPNKIALKGDKTIANLTYIQTKPIDINTLMNNENVLVELDLPPNVSLLNPDEKITISLKVEETFTKTFEYKLDEIDIRGLDSQLALDHDDYSKTIEAIVKGNNDILENLSKEDLVLYLDLSMLHEGIHEVDINFITPTGVTVKEINPKPIELNLIKR